MWIWLKNEKLQNYCFRYREEKLMSLLNPKLPRYGPGLGVAMARLLGNICSKNQTRQANSPNQRRKEEAREVHRKNKTHETTNKQ